VTLSRVLGQRAKDDRVGGRAELRHWLEQHRGDHVRGRVEALPRQASREQLVGEHSPRKLITARVDRIGPELLRRHVGQRADQRARLGQRGQIRRRVPGVHLGPARDAEVDDLHDAVVTNDHVARLDVSVNKPPIVGSRESARHVDEPAEPRRFGDARVADRLAQRSARHVLHRDERLSLDLAHVVHRDDVGMVEGRRGARFTGQAGRCGAVALRAKHLERDRPAELRVERAQDTPHAAFAEGAVDAVSAEPLR
jgi:hypothetical protein